MSDNCTCTYDFDPKTGKEIRYPDPRCPMHRGN